MTSRGSLRFFVTLCSIIVVSISLFSCKAKGKDNSKDRLPVVMKTMKDSTGAGWGYEVYVDHKLFIKQPVIPAVPGNHAFFSEADAKLAGDLVVKKITHGQQPFITQDELHQLKITLP